MWKRSTLTQDERFSPAICAKLLRSGHSRKCSTYHRVCVRFSQAPEHQDRGTSHPAEPLILGLALLVASVAAIAATATVETVSRVFTLEHISVSEASAAVQPMLSEHGSLILQPSRSRMTVQDLPQVVQRVAILVADIDSMPESYRIQVELLEGRSEPYSAATQTQIDQRLRKMFKFPSFRQLGSAVLEGELGSPAPADLGGGFQISFLTHTVEYSEDTPWGAPDPGERIHLRPLILKRVSMASDGTQEIDILLRTNVLIAPKQKVYIGAGSSEDAENGLVLIVHSQGSGGS
jgi:hypothetical protein